MKHTRPPDLYLPINRSLWNSNTLETNGDILEIWSMCWNDELRLKNPDGLINGYAIHNIIKKRIPDIKNPWEIPESEFHKLILGLWIATNGNNIPFTVKCSHCNEWIDVEIDFGEQLDNWSDQSTGNLKINNLEIYFKPSTYKNLIEYRNNNYRLNRMMYSIEKNPEKSISVVSIQQELNQYRLNQILQKTNRIHCIKADSILIQQHEEIQDIVSKLNRDVEKSIDNFLTSKTVSNQKQVKCYECEKIFSVKVNLDPSEQFYHELLSTDDEEISKIFEKLDKQATQIREECARIAWYMRGSVSYDQIMEMSPLERSSLIKVINDNIETTKKTGINFI